MQSNISSRRFLRNASLGVGAFDHPQYLLRTASTMPAKNSKHPVTAGTVSIMDIFAQAFVTLILTLLSIAL